MTSVFARTLKPALLAASAIAFIGLGPAQAASEYYQHQEARPNALDHAVRLIEKDTGGRVLEIRQHEDGGRFVAVVAVRGAPREVVRLEEGNTMTKLTADSAPEWTRDFNHMRARDARHARFDMSDAIARAAADSDSVPVDAHFTERGAIMAYDIHLVGPEHRSTVVIDANTGQRIASPQEFEGG